MKKIFVLVLSLGVLCISACGAKEIVTSESEHVVERSVKAESTEGTTELATEVPETTVAEKQNDGAVYIYLTRHGKTMLNTTDRVQGWADSPLTEKGVEVAEALGRGLERSAIKFTDVYSSDSGRAIETAKIVLAQVGQENLEIKQLKELREWNFGGFEGGYNSEMVAAIEKTVGYEGEEDIRQVLTAPELADGIAAADELQLAEDWDAIAARAESALTQITQEVSAKGGGNVLVVSHGMTINAILRVIDPEHQTIQFSNAAVTTIKYENGKYELLTVNDNSYIDLGKTTN